MWNPRETSVSAPQSGHTELYELDRFEDLMNRKNIFPTYKERTHVRKMELMKQGWQKAFEEITQSPGLLRIRNGDFSLEHYKSFLRQIFYYVREHPQIQAYAIAFLKGERREITKFVFRQLTAEVGHEQLILEDLKVLGADVSEISYQRPLPATLAMISFAYYQIQHLNPVGHLGYLFHLKTIHSRAGKMYLEALKKADISEKATSFLRDQSKIDIVHNALMDSYAENLIRSEHDLDSVIYSARVTARLYAAVVDESFRQADCPQNWGINYQELESVSPLMQR